MEIHKGTMNQVASEASEGANGVGAIAMTSLSRETTSMKMQGWEILAATSRLPVHLNSKAGPMLLGSNDPDDAGEDSGGSNDDDLHSIFDAIGSEHVGAASDVQPNVSHQLSTAHRPF